MKKQRINIQLDPETLEDLKVRAYYRGLSVSSLIRLLILDHLRRGEEGKLA